MRRARVYVAGPMLGSGNPYVNVYKACEVGMRLLDAGLAPHIPQLNANLEMSFGARPVEVWLALDHSMLLACDALLRLEGASPGGDQEVKWAHEAKIPVFYSLDTLFAWHETWRGK